MICCTISGSKKKYASNFSFFRVSMVGLLVLFILGGCTSKDDKESNNDEVNIEEDNSFGRAMAIGHIDNKEIDEASGLVVHRGKTNYLWTHNDSGDKARIFLFQKNGRSRAEYHLQGTTNRDWEDIAIGPGPQPDSTYLYIGDIGDNFVFYSDYAIYRLKQPGIPPKSTGGQLNKTITGVDKLRFTYPDGESHDAETLFIDPSTRDLYIVTREEIKDRVYRYDYPQSTSKIDTVAFVGELPFNMFAGGELSRDGQTLLLKTLRRIFIWHRRTNQSIPDMLSEKPKEVLPYGTGPQEEAIAIGPQKNGYYTLSESKGKSVTLYYHPAKRRNKK